MSRAHPDRQDVTAAVLVQEVTKRFGDVVAVDAISFTIGEGEFFSLLGPSGCGKTTTLRMLGGFEYPDSGEISIGGRRMGYTPAYERETNMVFQQLALFPHLDVFNNIAFGLKLRHRPMGEIRERVAESLRLVGLEGYERRRVNQLSGGQQQRVALARALVNQPRVVLLDEPLGSLDLQLRLQMQLELKHLQERLRSTFVYVTHDQGEAMTMSDRIAVMDRGRIVQIGTPSEIYEHPRTRFVASFIGDTNLLLGRVEGHGTSDRLSVRAGGAIVSTRAIGALSPGQSVWLSIRCERVRIGEHLEGSGNIFLGRVTEVIYVGSMLKYEVRTAEGLTVKVHVPNTRDQSVIPSGAEVRVEWDPEHAIVLTE